MGDGSGTAVTYGELDRRSRKLADRLCAAGVGPDDLVAVEARRSLELVTALLAVLRAGAAYLPVDPEWPAERLRWMLADAGAPLLLVRRGGRDRWTEVAGPAVAVLEIGPEAPEISAEARAIEAGGAAVQEARAAGARRAARAPEAAGALGALGLAYVAYTSGTTGRPKGVQVTHRGVARLVLGADYARFGPGETLLQLAPLAFDASTLEIWGALATGGRLVMYPEARPDGREVADTLARHGVTTLWLTAGLFHRMAEDHLAGLAPVRQLLAGGDVVSSAHLRGVARLLAAAGGQVSNLYGPTENTTFTTGYPVRDPERLGACACSTAGCNRCPSVSPASCSPPATAWRAAISADPS